MQSKSSKKSLSTVSSAKKPDLIDLLTLLDKCTQILKDDRTLLRKKLKDGDKNIESLLIHHRKKPEMSILQQELRKIVKNIKNPLKNIEKAVLAPINLQNRGPNAQEKHPLIEKAKPLNEIRGFKGPLRVFPGKPNEFPQEYLELPFRPIENQENFIEKTQKSPLLANNFPVAEEYEQNTIINVKFDDFREEPRCPQAFLEKPEGNFLSFKEFNEQNDDFRNPDVDDGETMKKSDFLEKIKKLSFKEEDYFDKSVKLEKPHPLVEENCSFELLNRQRTQQQKPPDQDDAFQEQEGEVTHGSEKTTNPAEGCPNNAGGNSSQSLSEKEKEGVVGVEEGEKVLIDSEMSLRFARPYDLPVTKRDQYIDSILFKFRFQGGKGPETARFQSPSEKSLLINAKFEKREIEKMRNRLGLDRLTAETIVNEVFAVGALTKISRTFFKIRLQTLLEKILGRKLENELLGELFDLCDLKKDGFLDINELGFSLDLLCLLKDSTDTPARRLFSELDKDSKRLIPLETLSSAIRKDSIGKILKEADRENKGFITYWDIYQVYLTNESR